MIHKHFYWPVPLNVQLSRIFTSNWQPDEEYTKNRNDCLLPCLGQGITFKSQTSLVISIRSSKVPNCKNNYKRGTQQSLDSYTAYSHCCTAKCTSWMAKISTGILTRTHAHSHTQKCHMDTHTNIRAACTFTLTRNCVFCIATTLSANAQRVDVYCANVSNLERSNMICKTGGEQKCMWRNVWFMSFEMFLKETHGLMCVLPV